MKHVCYEIILRKSRCILHRCQVPTLRQARFRAKTHLPPLTTTILRLTRERVSPHEVR